MAALLRAAAARAQAAGEAEGPQSNAVLRMLGKRAAERSPSVSPAKAERDSAPEPHEKVPFQLGELNESMDELGEGGESQIGWQPPGHGPQPLGRTCGGGLDQESDHERLCQRMQLRVCFRPHHALIYYG